jgi:hypothetical protein
VQAENNAPQLHSHAGLRDSVVTISIDSGSNFEGLLCLFPESILFFDEFLNGFAVML